MKYKIIFLIMFFSLSVHARLNDLGYMEVIINKEAGTISTSLDFNPKMLGNPVLPFHSTLGKSFWRMGALRCEWRNTASEIISDERIKVSGIAVCPEIKSELKFDLLFLKNGPDFYRILSRVQNDGEESILIYSKKKYNMRLTPRIEHSFTHFIHMGAEHIGATPGQWFSSSGLKMPKGIDHVLFILALIFTGGSFIQTIKSITGFTIGHALSLLVSIFGLVSVPASLIEPAIALSIVYVAATAFLSRRPQSKFWPAALFGIVHGFGFAATLTSLKLPFGKTLEALIGFNLGVEMGQLIIFMMIIPLLLLIKKYSNYHPQFMRSSALGVLIIGCYWFIERAIL